jgi:hypothetical protein
MKERAAKNRALAEKHMPEFLRLFDECRAIGMEPKMVHFEIYGAK